MLYKLIYNEPMAMLMNFSNLQHNEWSCKEYMYISIHLYKK